MRLGFKVRTRNVVLVFLGIALLVKLGSTLIAAWVGRTSRAVSCLMG